MCKLKEEAKKYLAGLEEQLKNKGIDVQSEVPVGRGADEIINYADKNPFTLIVMATHGRSGLSRLVYGSVAEDVLLGVSNPLFLVKPQ